MVGGLNESNVETLISNTSIKLKSSNLDEKSYSIFRTPSDTLSSTSTSTSTSSYIDNDNNSLLNTKEISHTYTHSMKSNLNNHNDSSTVPESIIPIIKPSNNVNNNKSNDDGNGNGNGNGNGSNKETKSISKEERDKARRVSHSAIEKRRRERINEKIDQLKKLVPNCNNTDNLHKLSVLQGAISYIVELKTMLGMKVPEDVVDELLLEKSLSNQQQTQQTQQPAVNNSNNESLFLLSTDILESIKRGENPYFNKIKDESIKRYRNDNNNNDDEYEYEYGSNEDNKDTKNISNSNNDDIVLKKKFKSIKEDISSKISNNRDYHDWYYYYYYHLPPPPPPPPPHLIQMPHGRIPSHYPHHSHSHHHHHLNQSVPSHFNSIPSPSLSSSTATTYNSNTKELGEDTKKYDCKPIIDNKDKTSCLAPSQSLPDSTD